MRKIISIMLAVVMLLGLAACGGSEPAASAPAASQSTAATTTTTSSTASTEEVQEIRFWEMMWGPAGKYDVKVQELCDKFHEEYPNIIVTPEFHTWDNYYQEFLTAVTGGMAPDVSTGAFNQSVQYAQMGELLDLTSIVDEWKADGTYDKFPAGSFELHNCYGIQAGIPWYQDTRVITYNEEILKKAGITKAPTNWDELLEAFRAIKKNTGVIPITWAAGSTNSSQVFCNFLFENETGMTDETGKKSAIDGQACIETLEFLGTLVEEGLVAPGTASYQTSDIWQLYNNEEVAFVIGNAPTTSRVSDEAMIAKTKVLNSISAKPGQEPGGLTYVNPIVAYNQTKYPEACKTFIKWWIENAVVLLTTEGGATGLPAIGVEDSFFTDDVFWSQTVANVLPYSKMPIYPAKGLYAAFSAIDGELIVGKLSQEVLTGSKDYVGLAAEYSAMVQKYLDENN